MKLETQTQLISILVFAALMLAFAFSLIASGVLEESTNTSNGSSNDELNATFAQAEIGHHIELKVSGFVVVCEYVGPEVEYVDWSFGDGVGHRDTTKAAHTYDNDGPYLVTMYVKDHTGRYTTEYAVAEIKGNVLADINVPGTDQNVRILTSTLLVVGCVSLFMGILSSEDVKRRTNKKEFYIPPRAFTPRLRVTLGIGFLFCAVLASGFLNPLFGG